MQIRTENSNQSSPCTLEAELGLIKLALAEAREVVRNFSKKLKLPSCHEVGQSKGAELRARVVVEPQRCGSAV